MYIENQEKLLQKGINEKDLLNYIENAEQMEAQLLTEQRLVLEVEAIELFIVLGNSLHETTSQWNLLSPKRKKWYYRAAREKIKEDYLYKSLS